MTADNTAKTTISIQDFIAKEQLTMEWLQVPARPDALWQSSPGAFHYMCTFGKRGRGHTGHDYKPLLCFYTKGAGHVKNGRPIRPTIDEVLNSLALDVSYSNQFFEEWAESLGYDTDSRAAYATWTACQKIARDLQEYLGGSGYLTLINDVEKD